MKDFRDIGGIEVSYRIDENSPGKPGRCKGCGFLFKKDDEKIILKSGSVSIPLCFQCSLNVAKAIRGLLGYE